MKPRMLVLTPLGVLATAAPLLAGPTIDVVVRQGDAASGAPGSTITALNSPFTDGNGNVGFTGTLENKIGSTNFVWYDTGVVWLNTDALPTVLTGAEGTMGISDTGDFIYSPSTDGDDSVWNSAGLIIKENDPAPGLDPNLFVSFASRPQMSADGTAHFVGGWTDTINGGTIGRVLWRVATNGDITPVLTAGDVIDGLAINLGSGVDFDYHLSDDVQHHVHVLTMDTGSSLDDGVVYVDGSLVAREADPIPGGGENWDNFDVVSINNNGDYLFSGDTDGATTSDEFIAYNGEIKIREGDVLDGVELTSSASVRDVSINDNGIAVHAWGVSSGAEHLFAAPADDLQNSVLLLSTGDTIDTDDDLIDDATVIDLNASSAIGPGLNLAEDGFVYIEVDLQDINTLVETEAILRLALPSFACPGDFDDDGQIATTDLLQLLAAWGPCAGCPQDLDHDDVVDTVDLLILLGLWGPC